MIFPRILENHVPNRISACKSVVDLCNKVWIDTNMRHAWDDALVSAVFTESDTNICDNCRPIFLLALGYTLFAFVLLKR